jgi:hypothetical protein
MKRPFELYFLYILILFLGISGLFGGAMLTLKPDGALLKMDPDWINDTPFNNYLIPGLILFLLIGAFPLFTLSGLLLKPDLKPANIFNIYSDKYWAWTYSLFTGIMSIIWITIQQMLTSYFWIQSFILCIGLLILIFTMMPRIIKYYSVKTETKIE